MIVHDVLRRFTFRLEIQTFYKTGDQSIVYLLNMLLKDKKSLEYRKNSNKGVCVHIQTTHFFQTMPFFQFNFLTS